MENNLKAEGRTPWRSKVKKVTTTRGVPRNLKREVSQFKAKPAGPDIVKSSKKKVITSAGVLFYSRNQVNSKKESLSPSQMS